MTLRSRRLPQEAREITSNALPRITSLTIHSDFQTILLLSFTVYSLPSADCKVEPGPWSNCDPCTLIRTRSLNIIQQPQMYGKGCPQKRFEIENCQTEKQCNQQNDTTSNQTNNNQLLYDIECLLLSNVPYLDIVSSGIDVMQNPQIKGRIFNNHHYTPGTCRKVTNNNGGTIYRIPANLDNVQFEVKANGQIEVNSFVSNYQYTKFMQKSSESSGSFGFGFGVFPRKSFSQSSTYQTICEEMKSQKAVLFQVKTQVSLAQFIYKATGFKFSQYFVDSVNKLPAQRDDDAYFNFFKQYGTYYTHSGIIGGKYEFFYVFTDDTMQKLSQNSETLRECLKVSTKMSLFGFKTGGSDTQCKNIGNAVVDATDVAASALKKIVNVAGGTATIAGKLAGSPTESTGMTKFEDWVVGVQQNPVMLQHDVYSICNLFLESEFTRNSSDINKLIKTKQLCINATVKFYEPYEDGKCHPCKNGGLKLNVGGVCQCACRSSFFGDLCESQWSGISGERKTVPDNPIKLILSDGIAVNPPVLGLTRHSWQFGGVLKNYQNKLYHLISDMDQVTSDGKGGFAGNYLIQIFDEFLALERTVEVNFATLSGCNPDGRSVACRINDFLISCTGQVIVSVGHFEMTSHYSYSSLYMLNDNGTSVSSIQNPCAEWGSDWKSEVFIAATCSDNIVVSCPATPAVIKIYAPDGSGLSLSQLPTILPITGIMICNSTELCVHTTANEIASYDMTTWELRWYGKFPTTTAANQAKSTQIGQDFLSNFIIGQCYKDKATTQPIAQVIDGALKTVILTVTHSNWTECNHVAAYSTKMFLSCKSVTPSPQPRGLFSIDYLK